MKPILWCVFAFLVTALSAQAQIAPSILSISSSRQLTEGQSVSLTVAADGTAPLSYQWKKDGTAIAGATSATYSIASVTTSDTGSYTVTVSNSSGAVDGGPVLVDVAAAVAPVISYQPGNATITAGDSLGLYVYLSAGTSPLQYVWKKDNVTVKTATNDNQYSKSNVSVSDAGTYTVTVTNAVGTATSTGIVVTVNALTAPVFNSQPSDATIAYGNSAYLYSSVTNSNGVTFQWYKDDVAIAGATSYYYYYATTSGNYKVIATNSAGSTSSRVASVTVLSPVAPNSLSISPSQVKTVVGEYFSFYVSASGSSPFTYQWRKDGKDIPGANSYYFSKSNVTVDDTGTYSVVVTNVAGSATSPAASVSITGPVPPVITQQPTSIGVFPGDSAWLSVAAAGTGSLHFQWKKDGVTIPGATNSSFYVSSSVAASDAGSYTVVVWNDFGTVVSSPAIVTVFSASAPQITAQPANISVVLGQTISLSVSATGHPAPTYQWKKDGVNIPNATSSSYYKGNAAADDAGSYTVVVSNTAGSVTSSAATVTVVSAAALVITEHPSSFSVVVGSSSYGLSVGFRSSTWTGAYTIDWYLNDVLIPGAHSNSYSIYNAQPEQAGTYKAKITNTTGSVTTYGAVVTVDLSSSRPVITYTSGSKAIAEGASAYINIETSPSVLDYTVQWKKDGVVVPNAFSAGLSIPSFESSLAGTYTAEVTTASGTYVSQPVVLSVLQNSDAPRIMRQPASANRIAGESVSFSVDVDSATPVTFQWRKNGVDIPGATGIYTYYYWGYELYNLKTTDAGSYSVVLTNSAGSVTSNAAVLSVSALSSVPIFASQPTSRVLNANNPSLWLSVSLANPSPSDKYQWYKDGAPIIGATSSSYNYYNYYNTTPDSRLAGTYKVVVTNSVGSSTSNNAVITVETPAVAPTFTLQPANRIGSVGGYVTFNSVATGTPAITYQWRKDGLAISGATGSTLTLTNLQLSDVGSYSVLATNSGGTTVSATASLTISAPIVLADLSGDGKPDLTWQNIVTGERKIWTMNGVSFSSDAPLGVVDLSWKIVGTGDFDGNGTADIVWENRSSGLRYLWYMEGSTHTGDASLGTLPVEWTIATVADFDRDSHPDLLWQNVATGSRRIWLMNATTRISDVDLGAVPAEWHAAGAGDFDGDGYVDLLWENSATGERYIWLMNGTSVAGGLSLGVVPVAWRIAAVSDYSGDGKPDIAWENIVTGQCSIWTMNGTTITANLSLGTVPTEWRMGGVSWAEGAPDSDFNLDGNPDIIWQNLSTGARKVGLMSGATHLSDIDIGTVDPAWKIVGQADFDANGTPDLVWENSNTGQRYLWYMDGTKSTAGATLGYAPLEWKIGAVADINGDQKPDLIWQNSSTGERRVWLMNGASISDNLYLSTVATEWVIVGADDFNSDGKVDLIWENRVSGQRYIWLMNGATFVAGANLGFVPVAWRIGNVADYNGDGSPDLVWENSSTGERVIWLMNGVDYVSTQNIGTVPVEWRMKP